MAGILACSLDEGRDGSVSACEKCWAEAGGDADRYAVLIKGRTCTPEEQAGPAAAWCPDCGRVTLHQHTRECMNPECDK